MLQKRTGREVRGVSPGAGRESMVGKTCERGRCWMWFTDSDDVIGQGWIQDLLVWAIVIGWSYKQEGTCEFGAYSLGNFWNFRLKWGSDELVGIHPPGSHHSSLSLGIPFATGCNMQSCPWFPTSAVNQCNVTIFVYFKTQNITRKLNHLLLSNFSRCTPFYSFIQIHQILSSSS